MMTNPYLVPLKKAIDRATRKNCWYNPWKHEADRADYRIVEGPLRFFCVVSDTCFPCFKFEKDEDLDFALNSLRGRVGIGAGDFAGFDAGTKLLQPTVYAKKNPKADVFAREYAVRKFVNKKSDQFYGFAKHQGQNSNADALGASRRSMIVSFYLEGLKDAKKQEFLGKPIFEFPADLKTPVVSKINPISYDPINHAYLRFGESVGKAFNIGRTLK